MPTYDYKCKGCQYEFEELLPIRDHEVPTKTPCPQCGELSVTQLIKTAIPLGDPVYLGVRKLPSEWRSFLKTLKKNNPGCNVNDR